MLEKIKKKLEEYDKILSITKKPDREEFSMSVKITGLGLVVLMLAGLAIFIAVKMSGVFG